MSEPVIERTSDWGHVRASFPSPPRASYDVAHEVLLDYVDKLNELAELRAWLAGKP